MTGATRLPGWLSVCSRPASAKRWAVSAALVCAIAIGPAAPPASAQNTAPKRSIETTRIGNWRAQTFVIADTGVFSHCAIGAGYRSGVDLIFSIGPRVFDLGMALASPNWSLTPGATSPVSFHIDRRRAEPSVATAVDGKTLRIELRDSEQLFSNLRRGRALYVSLPNGRYDFRLTGTNRALRWLRGCAEVNAQRYGKAGSSTVDPLGSSAAPAETPPPVSVAPGTYVPPESATRPDNPDIAAAAPDGEDTNEGMGDGSDPAVLDGSASPDGNEDISSDIEMSDELAAFFLANSLSSAGLGDFTISSGEGDGITNIELGSVFATMERLDPEDVAAAQALQRDLIGAEAIMCEGFFGTRGGADRDRVAMRFTTTCENDGVTEQSETIALDTGSLGILFILRGPPEETARVAQQLLEGALARLDDLP